MSRSKRAAGEVAPAPRERTAWYKRAGWLLAVSLVGYAAAAVGLRLLLDALLGALFRAWGLEATTVARAPAWARTLWRWQGSLVTVIVSAALLGLSLGLRRLWGLAIADLRPRGKPLAAAALTGLGLAAVVLLAGLIPDSLRLEPAAPRLTASLPTLVLASLLAATAEEAFTKGVLYDGITSRWGPIWATAAACAAFFMSNGGLAGSALSGINVLLLGFLCCIVHARFGLWAAIGLRWGWSVATVFLMGFGGGEASVLRFYGVSETLLTGGDAGPIYGLYATLALALPAAFLLRRKR